MVNDLRMPALYIGHGAPPLLDDPLWSSQLAAWAQDLPRPKAILIVSAHWESAPLSLSASGPGVGLVYDFGGFEERYYRMTYPTPYAGVLADRVAAMMPRSEPVHQHTARGLDHGAWVPLRIMYPDADVPVLQMSLPTHDPATLLRLGERLRPLRDEGVLIVGSGFLKANISVIVGQLYRLRDPRRDAAYTIFYMGVNTGAALGTMLVGYLGETIGWAWGFGLAGIGMVLGLIIFMIGKPALKGQGEPPAPLPRGREMMLYGTGAAAVVVNHGDKLIDDAQVKARGTVVESAGVPIPANPVRLTMGGEVTGTATEAPHQVGQDTDDVLAELGLTPVAPTGQDR